MNTITLTRSINATNPKNHVNFRIWSILNLATRTLARVTTNSNTKLFTRNVTISAEPPKKRAIPSEIRTNSLMILNRQLTGLNKYARHLD